MADIDQELSRSERHSLLDMLEHKNQMAGRKTILHRVTIVGKLRNNFENKARIGEYYDRMFRILLQQQQQSQKEQANSNNSNSKNVVDPFQEKVTGVMIIYPTLMVHIIESSLETIKNILKDLSSICQDPEGMISNAKILNFAHEIHVRLFPIYFYKTLNLNIEFDTSDPSESVDVLVSDVLIRLLRMGKYFNEQSRGQLRKESIDNLHETHPEFFPNQNYVNYLLKNNDLWSPDEYLNYYKKPINVILESELTWPAPSKLFPYQ